MVSDAKKRANARYDSQNMVQRVVRFSPNERDLLEHLDAQPNKAGYIKQLIRNDMERGGNMDGRKHYEFESANMGTVQVDVVGEWRDGSKDLQVEVGDSCKVFDEVDGGSAEDVITWLLREGVEFESTRSMWFNSHYIAEVMLDGDATQDDVVDAAAAKTDEELDRWKETWIDD